MTRRDAAKMAERIGRLAKALGYTVEHSVSNLSEAQYLEIVARSDADDSEGDVLVGPFRVRVASHDARPTYERLNGEADYEVGPHGAGCIDGWAGVVAALARTVGRPVPPIAARELARLEKIRAARAAAAEASRRRGAEIAEHHAALTEAAMRAYPIEWAAAQEKSPARRREKQRQLRRRYERDFGSPSETAAPI